MDVRFKAKFRTESAFKAKFRTEGNLSADFGNVIQVHTDDYNDLLNKPSINEVELVGNKTFEDLGDHMLTNIEIKKIFDRVFKGGQ